MKLSYLQRLLYSSLCHQKESAFNKILIYGQSLQDLEQIIVENGFEKYRAKQVFHYVYRKGVNDFRECRNLPTSLIDFLSCKFSLGIGVKEMTSSDGTRKWLTEFDEKTTVESVLIPEEERTTLCISSQVGCSLSCTFCHTGTQKLQRNLTTNEILAQYLIPAKQYGEFPLSETHGHRRISNIVFMGQGEPLYNWRNVKKAIELLTDQHGVAFSKSKITLSTSGITPLISKVGSELGIKLAISLHASNNDLRSELMAINKTYPMGDLIEECKRFPSNASNKTITFEYVMLKNINDSLADAKDLAKLLSGIPCLVNLIPFNPWPGTKYQSSEPYTIAAFKDLLGKRGIQATIRTPRGQDILAACGQLKSLLQA